jgi:hypothetical protein
MPNGVMTGNGSKTNPFIVMDGYDFNALRNITTSTSDYKYIEIGADISLSTYVSFVPIPEKHFNIDGRGHSITDIKIIAGTNEVGLFARLYSNEYIKDLTIEGDLAVNFSNSVTSGAFCGRLYLMSNAIISNVDAYFTLIISTTSGLTVGGLAGVIEISGRSNSGIIECAFKGTIDAASTNSGTSFAMTIGGMVGQVYNSNPNPDDILLIDKCFSNVNYRVNNRMNMRMGGILGDMNSGFNTNSQCFQLMIRRCVARITMRFTHTSAVTTNTHRVCGIACYPAYWTGQVTTVEKCVAFIDVLWTHTFPINAFRIAGLLFAGTASNQVFTIRQGYAVMRLINPDNLPWAGITDGNIGSVTFLPSSSPTVRVFDAFFDKEVFREYYNGAFTEEHGVTTAELKDEAFLTLRGWEFDE